MPRSATETKGRILSASFGLLYREGFSRVSMDSIAAASGVTKRTLYHHFNSKDSLVAEMLERQHEFSFAKVKGWSDAEAETPEELLSGLFDGLLAWAGGEPWFGSGFTRLTMELADLPGHPARLAARRHKMAIECWLAEEFDRLGESRPRALAREVVLLIEGSVILALIHQETSYIEAAANAALRLANGQDPDIWLDGNESRQQG